MPGHATLLRLGEIAEDQWGLVTRQQAEAAGVSPATIARLSAAEPGPAVLERIAPGVFHLRGAPLPDHVNLRAAWLRLAPDVPAWRRTADQGTVSHRSAASMYALGHLPADRHEFTLARRRQSRRPDVRLHLGPIEDGDWVEVGGLPVMRPARTAADLLADREDPGAVAQVIADAIGRGLDQPGAFVESLGPHAARFVLQRGDGRALLAWLLDLAAGPDTATGVPEVADVRRAAAHGRAAAPWRVRGRTAP